MRLCEPHQALSRPLHQLGIGREGDRLLLHGGVEDHLGEVGGLGRAGAGGDGQALLQERQQPLLAEALAPARQRRALERQLVLKELLATEQLEIRVLQPARTERLVGEIVQVLEDRQAGHQPGGQRRPAGIIVVELAEARLEKAPVDRARERHQRVSQVDDLIEPRPEQIRLATLASLLRSHRQNHPASPRWRQGITLTQVDQFARKHVHSALKPANANTCQGPKLTPAQGLRSSSRTTSSFTYHEIGWAGR